MTFHFQPVNTHIKNCILLLLLLLLRVLDPPGQVVDHDELDEGGVDEEHADTVPHVHGCQVGDNWQLRPEPEKRKKLMIN